MNLGDGWRMLTTRRASAPISASDSCRATLVTPPGAPHSHHNAGPRSVRFLIVQDGGLHYHARTMGFEFLEGVGKAS